MVRTGGLSTGLQKGRDFFVPPEYRIEGGSSVDRTGGAREEITVLGWRGSPGSPGEIVAMHSKVSVEGLDGARAVFTIRNP